MSRRSAAPADPDRSSCRCRCLLSGLRWSLPPPCCCFPFSPRTQGPGPRRPCTRFREHGIREPVNLLVDLACAQRPVKGLSTLQAHSSGEWQKRAVYPCRFCRLSDSNKRTTDLILPRAGCLVRRSPSDASESVRVLDLGLGRVPRAAPRWGGRPQPMALKRVLPGHCETNMSGQ